MEKRLEELKRHPNRPCVVELYPQVPFPIERHAVDSTSLALLSSLREGHELWIEVNLYHIIEDRCREHDTSKGHKIDERLGIVSILQLRPDLGGDRVGIDNDCLAEGVEEYFFFRQDQGLRVEARIDERPAKEGDGNFRVRGFRNGVREDPDRSIGN